MFSLSLYPLFRCYLIFSIEPLVNELNTVEQKFYGEQKLKKTIVICEPQVGNPGSSFKKTLLTMPRRVSNTPHLIFFHHIFLAKLVLCFLNVTA